MLKAIVVGAGLAGLTAARLLRRAGWEVVVVEATDGIGGRVRTEVVDGFRLDRGFQALFTAAPAVQRQLDLKALKLRPLDAGAVLVEGGRWNEIGDPLKDPKSLAPTLLSSLPLTSDKLALWRLRRELASGRLEGWPETGTAEFLRAYGFSERFLDLFLRGVLGGMFLDRSLDVSSHFALGQLKAVLAGRAALPAGGMQAIPDQLAAELPAGDVRLQTPALRLERTGDRVAGVQTPNETLEAGVVLLAAHSPEVERLCGLSLPKEAFSATCLYFHLPYPLYGHKKVVVNGYADGFVSHAIQVTNVAAGYAPAPEHLLAATVLGAPDLTAEELARLALQDMQRWFPWRQIGGLRALAVYQLPFARLAQPPGYRAGRPGNRTSVPGLYLAGEYTEDSSIDGALASGEKAAQAILEDAAA